MTVKVTATGHHLPYGITQCYLPPDTSERAPPNPSHAGWYSIYVYPEGMEGWVHLVDLISPQLGVEPAQRPFDHEPNTKPLHHQDSVCAILDCVVTIDCVQYWSPSCSCCRLRVLNGTNNHLSSLPSLNNNPDLNNVRELYLSGNELGNDVLDVVGGYSRLRILYLAYNELTELYDRQVNISANLCGLCTANLQCLDSMF